MLAKLYGRFEVRIAITQRVENVVSYEERRDCLDQRWADLAIFLSASLFPLANLAMNALETTLETLEPDLVILSGGNSITALDKEASDIAPERDAYEAALLDLAVKQKIPVLGVCRGMQMINLHFGGKLQVVENHVAVRHKLKSHSETTFDDEVNSYHQWGLYDSDIARGFNVLASAEDGSIEAFRHANHEIFGIMWHPERGKKFSPNDIRFIKGIVKS